MKPTLLRRVLETAGINDPGRTPTADEWAAVLSAFGDALGEAERGRRAAEDRARLKSVFLANLSHEIRTPMNAVIGMTGLILDTTLDDEQREYAETVRKSGQHLLGLLNDLLEYSKLEAGHLTLESAAFDVRSVLDDVVELFAGGVTHRALDLVCRVHPDVPHTLLGDEGRLRQVLTNLVANAVRFTDEGGIGVHARLETVEHDRVALRIDVHDTGIGIPADQLSRLFQPFAQAHGSRRAGGTGLGLAIPREIVRRMGGDIELESREGRGTTFRVRVWLDLPPDQAQPSPAPVLSGVRTLVVDASASRRRMLVEQLEAWGMRTSERSAARAALETLQDAVRAGEPFDLIVIDQDLADTDGLAFARMVQASPVLRGVRFVLLAPFGRRPEKNQLIAAGINQWLTKPLRLLPLRGALIRALGGLDALTTLNGDDTHGPAHLGPVQARSLRVLVAEDNVVNQKLAMRLLERMGCRVDVVADGSEAVEALERIHYDVVLMDCQMPEMDGYEATRHVRAGNGISRDVPIIALTAHALDGERERCLSIGMTDYLIKPIDPKTLAAALYKHAGTSAVAGVTPPAPGNDRKIGTL